jgi:hypothetical protein
MKNVAIIWSKGTPETVVNYHTLERSKENEHFAEFFNDDLQAVHLKDSDLFEDTGVFKTAFLEEDYSAYFILAELNWHNHALTDFYGIKVAQQLRLNNVKAPVFVCSFMPEGYFLNSGQYKILSFRGHYLIQLPNTMQEEIEISALDEMELMDCKMHYCGIEGAIREIYHRKQHVLPEKDVEKGKKQILELINEIKNLKNLPEYLNPIIEKVIQEINDTKSSTDLKVFLKADDSKILAHLKEADRDIVNSKLYEAVKNQWQMLILEDVPRDIDSLIGSLKKAGIRKEDILLATNYIDAKRIIEKDRGNKIAVVICDYRLEDAGKIKGKQGYSFVEWLAKQDRFNEIFVYSGLSRRFLKETFKRYNIRVTVNSKYEITDKMSDFVDEVIEKGNEISDLITNRPTAEAWKELELYYSKYRQWEGYDKMESEVSEISRQVINQIRYLRDTIEKYDLKEKISFSKIQTFPNLTGRLFKDFEKVVVDNNPDLIKDFAEENIKAYTIKGKKDKETGKEVSKEVYYCFRPITDEKYRENYFKNKLIARRIAWWLIMCEGMHLNTIYSLLSKGEYFNYYFSKPENYDEWLSSVDNAIPEIIDAKTLINTRLAVIKEDFPFRLLVEEKNWFKYEMGTDLSDMMAVICGFENYFYDLFEEFNPKMNKNRNEYTDLKKSFIVNDKFVFHTANDIRKALELSIHCLENTDDKREIVYKILSRFDKNDLICKSYFDKLEKYALRQINELKNK